MWQCEDKLNRKTAFRLASVAQKQRVLKVYMTRQFVLRFSLINSLKSLKNFAFFVKNKRVFSPSFPLLIQNCIIVVATIFLRKHRKKCQGQVRRRTRNWSLFSISRYKSRELEEEDENKVPDRFQPKLALICVLVLGSKAQLSIANGTSSVGNETNENRTFLYRPRHLH